MCRATSWEGRDKESVHREVGNFGVQRYWEKLRSVTSVFHPIRPWDETTLLRKKSPSFYSECFQSVEWVPVSIWFIPSVLNRCRGPDVLVNTLTPIPPVHWLGHLYVLVIHSPVGIVLVVLTYLYEWTRGVGSTTVLPSLFPSFLFLCLPSFPFRSLSESSSPSKELTRAFV